MHFPSKYILLSSSHKFSVLISICSVSSSIVEIEVIISDLTLIMVVIIISG